MTSLKIDLQQSYKDVKIFSTKIKVQKEQAKLINAQSHLYKGTRPNSHVEFAQTYIIKLFEFFTFWNFHFLCGFGFLHTQKQKHKSKIKCKNNQNYAYKEMHDAQMHNNEAFNAWRVLQRSKELDQGPKEQKLNHKNSSLSKRNDCLEWASYEKWDEGWKNENRRCT